MKNRVRLVKLKKLYKGEYRPVDDQVLRWQQKMRKGDIAIGKHMREQRRHAKKRENKFAKDVKKIDFFGSDDE